MFPVYATIFVWLMFYYFMCFDCSGKLDEPTLQNLLLRGCKGQFAAACDTGPVLRIYRVENSDHKTRSYVLLRLNNLSQHLER
jgi:hypothetical protein